MQRALACLTCVVFLLIGSLEAHAQDTVIEIGPRLGYDLGGDVEAFFVGAEGRIALASLPVQISPAFDFYFAEENLTVFQISANAIYEFSLDNPSFTPYAGAGIGFTRWSFDAGVDDFFGSSLDVSTTETGINLLGGAVFEMDGGFKPFVQAQFTLSSVDIFTIGGGVLFTL